MELLKLSTVIRCASFEQNMFDVIIVQNQQQVFLEYKMKENYYKVHMTFWIYNDTCCIDGPSLPIHCNASNYLICRKEGPEYAYIL